jgi:hypothetical protein
LIPEQMMTVLPDRMIVIMRDADDPLVMETLANESVEQAKKIMPKITGALAHSLSPVHGNNFFGIYFPDKRAWYLEQGTNPFTMKSLAGKTIPMWIDDPDGEVAKEEGPKAKTRVTADGRRQTLIFRHAAPIGSRKMVFKRGQWVSVPRSYPGAPGRINNRSSNGRIAAGNVGVRWRHPGIESRHYLNRSIEEVAFRYGIFPDRVYLIDAATYPAATKS